MEWNGYTSSLDIRFSAERQYGVNDSLGSTYYAYL